MAIIKGSELSSSLFLDLFKFIHPYGLQVLSCCVCTLRQATRMCGY